MATAKKAPKPAAPKRTLSAAERTIPLLGKEMMVEQRDRNVPVIPEGPKVRRCFEMRAAGHKCEAARLPPGVIHDVHLTHDGAKTLCGLLAHREAKETYPGKVCEACRAEASKTFAEVLRG
jgi:hypothetical protein